MPYSIEQIRNLVLVGHSGSGKTSLAEAMVYCTGGINRLGRSRSARMAFSSDKEGEKTKRDPLIPIFFGSCRGRSVMNNGMGSPWGHSA